MRERSYAIAKIGILHAQACQITPLGTLPHARGPNHASTSMKRV